MAETKPKPNGAATGTATPPAQTPPEPAKTRTRLSFSKEQKLAFVVTGLVSILASKAVAAVLTEEQKAKVKAAETKANEVGGGDPFKAIDDRVKAIIVELKAIDYTKDLAKANEQAKELQKELDGQLKRKAQIQELIGK